LEGLAMENVGIFNTILSILRPNVIYGTFSGHFPVFVCCTEKNLANLMYIEENAFTP
jgi:hypothetical protein